jgi:hypothetical protein
MLETLVGSVFFDALVLGGLLYLLARHEADIDFQKLAMVVAVTALGNVGLRVAVDQVAPPGIQMWLQPLLEIALAAFMIMTFCWISFWKSLLVVAIFASLHVGFGFAMKAVARKVMGDEKAAPSLSEKHEAEILEAKEEMERMWRQQAGAPPGPANAPDVAPPATPAAEPVMTPADPVTTPAPAAEGTESALFGTPEPTAAATKSAGPSSPASPVDGWAEARKGLKIQGITKQGRVFTALINQRLVRSGDVVAVTHAGKVYRWTVQEIALGDVRFEPLDVSGP